MDSKQPPKFPAGEYVAPELDEREKRQCLERLADVPRRCAAAVEGLSEEQLDTRYRNWTIRQIIHHLADSHLNCYVRCKWALTEETPTIKSYDETAWSEVHDAQSLPLESSLQLLAGLHRRWTQLLASLSESQLSRGFFHPELDRVVTIAETLPSYTWHADHHLAQIHWVREQRGWNEKR